MIFLTTVFADSAGLVYFEESKANSNTNTLTARVQQDKLLDGTTYVKLHGHSEGDRGIEVESKRTQPEELCANLERLFRLDTKFLLSLRSGFYLGVISRLSTNQGRVIFTFIPEQRF